MTPAGRDLEHGRHAVAARAIQGPGPVPPDPVGLGGDSRRVSATMIDVEVNGYDPIRKCNVDGGAMAQVFLYPRACLTSFASRVRKSPAVRNVYVIRNARLDPNWAVWNAYPLDRRTRHSSLDSTQGVGDLYRFT